MKSESEVAQSCPTLSDSMDCSPPGSSAHGIFQARVLEWGAIAFSKVKDKRPVNFHQGWRPNANLKLVRETQRGWVLVVQVMPDSLRPHVLQRAGLPCASWSPRVDWTES